MRKRIAKKFVKYYMCGGSGRYAQRRVLKAIRKSEREWMTREQWGELHREGGVFEGRPIGLNHFLEGLAETGYPEAIIKHEAVT